MARISKGTRTELLQKVAERYQAATRTEKRRILDEFVAITGYHRKHAIRLLNADVASKKTRKGGRRRVYDEAVLEALIVLWEASDRVCGKRLKALLPVLVPALERHGHLDLDANVRKLVLSASAATIDRLLAPTRTAATGKTRKALKSRVGVRKSVPIRTFADWKEPEPGYAEVDLVSHCGGNPSGRFVHTLTLTDIASGWTECMPLVVRDASLVVEALRRFMVTLPFPLLGVDTDNGGEFINEGVIDFCSANGIEFTRSRPYKSNDQAWVEQKNGAVVRRLVGYRRLEGIGATEVLARLYAASRLFVNFFQPSFKLAEKKRIGARVTRRYHAPQTPCARLLTTNGIEEASKERLSFVAQSLDPLKLLDEIRTEQHHIASISTDQTTHVIPHRNDELDSFMKGLATAWMDGEVRPTHSVAPKPRRNWRTRKDPFESAWPIIREWLETDPDSNAQELLSRLQEERPGEFHDGQIRTLQRRVKEWRSARARELVFAGSPSPDVGASSDDSRA